MKKLFLAIIILSILLLSSCQLPAAEVTTPAPAASEPEREYYMYDIHSINGHYSSDYIPDDTVSLENAITHEYTLEELEAFFRGRAYEERVLIQERQADFLKYRGDLSIEEVNARFPVEVFRRNCYSVYKVKEGGYYYVLWKAQPVYGENMAEVKKLDWLVSRVMYLSVQTEEAFQQLEAGMKLEEIYNIDPQMQYVCFRDIYAYPRSDRSEYAYCYLNQEKIMRIRCNYYPVWDNVEILDMEIINREDSPVHGLIYACDLVTE